MQKATLTFSARINLSEFSISETVGRGGGRTCPEGNRLIVGPLGVQSRSGLGARVPFRWPRPETGKISLVRFPRNVQLSPGLPEANAFGFKCFRLSLGQLTGRRKVEQSCAQDAPASDTVSATQPAPSKHDGEQRYASLWDRLKASFK